MLQEELKKKPFFLTVPLKSSSRFDFVLQLQKRAKKLCFTNLMSLPSIEFELSGSSFVSPSTIILAVLIKKALYLLLALKEGTAKQSIGSLSCLKISPLRQLNTCSYVMIVLT